jgi:hypothetical protein
LGSNQGYFKYNSQVPKQCVYEIIIGNGQYPTFWQYWYNVKDIRESWIIPKKWKKDEKALN